MIRSRSHLDFQEKKRARRLLYSPLTFLGLLVLCSLVGSGLWGMYQKSQRADEALAQTQNAYAALQAREQFLDSEIDRLSTDAGVESEIRERFGVAKQGEGVIVVLSEEEKPTLPPKEKGLWERVKIWLSGGDDYSREEE